MRSKTFILVLAVGALVLVLAWGSGSAQKAHAGGDPAVNLSISTTGCDSSSGPATCSAPASGGFKLSFNVLAFMAGGYAAYDAHITFAGGINYTAGSLKLQGAGVWPDCVFTGSVINPGDLTFACAVGYLAPNSSYLGALATMDFTCQGVGTGTLTLVHGNFESDLEDAGAGPHSEETDETLTINCVNPDPKTGFKIAFQSNRDGNDEVYGMLADGSGQTNLTNNPATDGQPDWSPDGTKIAFHTNRDAGDYEIYTMNADGSSPARLTNSPGYDVAPAWSPDGTKIAFQSMRDGNWEIYVMNADGTNPINLTNNGALDANAAWSPGGTEIAFWSDADGDNEIYLMNADGTSRTQLTFNSVTDELPAWSPDGTRIAFDSNRDGNFEIYSHIGNVGQFNVTNASSNDQAPSWNTDGTQIVYHSDAAGNNDIWTMNANGTSKTNLTASSPAADVYPAWSRVSSTLACTSLGSHQPDTDCDGCPNVAEQQTGVGTETSGGRRDYLNPYDYFNPTHDGQNRVDDILKVVQQYYKDDNDGNPGVAPYAMNYSPDTDRSFVGPNQWNLGAPNGQQRVDDILNVVKQYYHDCS